MSGALDLARPELLALKTYTAGVYEPDTIRLNANESPWRLPGDRTERGLNIYPPPRPQNLTATLAEYYGTQAENLLVTRGSSEAIDVLIRAFCHAGQDDILICPPTFDMYRLYAAIQNAGVKTVPLLRDDAFSTDADAILRAIDRRTKLVFLCSPNNPTGHAVDRGVIEGLCEQLQGRALMVVDEAYFEFSAQEDCLPLLERFENLVVLRTLSKCVSLAGARCGALMASAEIVAFLDKVLPPYTFPTPSIELVLEALSVDSLTLSQQRIEIIKRERARLATALSALPVVERVFPSQANFLLIETKNGEAFLAAARRAGILLRRFGDDPLLDNCIRITVGTPEINDLLIEALSTPENAHEA